MKMKWVALAGAGVLTAACTTTGNVERGSVSGAAIGALAGAVLGNNVGGGSAATGAVIGAAIGGSAGAVRGCQQDGACGAAPVSRRQYYDERTRQYYFYDQRTGRFYYENGQPKYQ